jgi:hypothetical protein
LRVDRSGKRKLFETAAFRYTFEMYNSALLALSAAKKFRRFLSFATFALFV